MYRSRTQSLVNARTVQKSAGCLLESHWIKYGCLYIEMLLFFKERSSVILGLQREGVEVLLSCYLDITAVRIKNITSCKCKKLASITEVTIL